MRSFLPLVQIILIEEDIAEHDDRLKAQLASLGAMIPENDLWMAATTMARGLAWVTRAAHFSVLPR